MHKPLHALPNDLFHEHVSPKSETQWQKKANWQRKLLPLLPFPDMTLRSYGWQLFFFFNLSITFWEQPSLYFPLVCTAIQVIICISQLIGGQNFSKENKEKNPNLIQTILPDIDQQYDSRALLIIQCPQVGLAVCLCDCPTKVESRNCLSLSLSGMWDSSFEHLWVLNLINWKTFKIMVIHSLPVWLDILF